MPDNEMLVQQRLRRLWDEPGAGVGAAGVGAAGVGVGVGAGGVGGGGAVDDGRRPSRTAEPAPSDAVPALPPAEMSATADEAPARPSALTGPGAFDPGRRGVRALAAVAAVVVLAAAGWAWWSRPRVEPAPSPIAEADATMAAVAATPSAGGEVVVAVAGRVRRPGLVRLPAGSRVADAIEAAGGALPGTDPALLNLARRLTDGELIVVGVTPPPGTSQGGPAASGGGTGSVPGAKINLNTATLAQLDSLPGVGPVLAQRILDHRDRHGGFRSVSDLRQVDGIGDARYEQLKELVVA